MIDRTARRPRTLERFAPVLAVLGLMLAAVPALGHAPDPVIGWPAWNQGQVVRYRWMAGVPPAAMQTAIKAGAAGSNASRASRAPTFVYDSAGTSTVEYGTSVFCGVNGLACADARNAPHTFGWRSATTVIALTGARSAGARC